MDIIKILGASALLAIAVAPSPASAQILGGGGLGGSLGGTLGGLGGQMGGPGMLGSSFDRSSRDLPIAGDATGSLRGSTRSERTPVAPSRPAPVRWRLPAPRQRAA